MFVNCSTINTKPLSFRSSPRSPTCCSGGNLITHWKACSSFRRTRTSRPNRTTSWHWPRPSTVPTGTPPPRLPTLITIITHRSPPRPDPRAAIIICWWGPTWRKWSAGSSNGNSSHRNRSPWTASCTCTGSSRSPASGPSPAPPPTRTARVATACITSWWQVSSPYSVQWDYLYVL